MKFDSIRFANRTRESDVQRRIINERKAQSNILLFISSNKLQISLEKTETINKYE